MEMGRALVDGFTTGMQHHITHSTSLLSASTYLPPASTLLMNLIVRLKKDFPGRLNMKFALRRPSFSTPLSTTLSRPPNGAIPWVLMGYLQKKPRHLREAIMTSVSSHSYLMMQVAGKRSRV